MDLWCKWVKDVEGSYTGDSIVVQLLGDKRTSSDIISRCIHLQSIISNLLTTEVLFSHRYLSINSTNKTKPKKRIFQLYFYQKQVKITLTIVCYV